LVRDTPTETRAAAASIQELVAAPPNKGAAVVARRWLNLSGSLFARSFFYWKKDILGRFIRFIRIKEKEKSLINIIKPLYVLIPNLISKTPFRKDNFFKKYEWKAIYLITCLFVFYYAGFQLVSLLSSDF
jgi:hypothetical protein